MIVLPVGHEQGTVRRLPWVTFGIMGLCVAALIVTPYAGVATEERAEKLVQELSELFKEHPHVVLSDEDMDFMFAGMDEESRAAILEMYRAKRSRVSTWKMEEIQAEFDRLMVELMALADAHPYRRWGLVPAKLSLVGFITHMFMHGGWVHLIGNLLLLYLAGPFVEDVWGRGLYAGFYVASGVVAAILFMGMHPGLNVPLIGASGAIAGVMGAFLVRYWNTHIHFFYIFFLVTGTFSAPAWIMLPMWFLEQFLMASLSSGSQPAGGVAYWAHVGGFVFGVGAALAMRHYRIEERLIHPKLDALVNKKLVDNPVLEQALEASATGAGPRALAMLMEEARRLPRDRDVALALWSVAVQEKRLGEAAPLVLALIEDELRCGETRGAINHWLDLVDQVPDISAPPALLVRLARVLSESGRLNEAAGALRLALLDPAGAMTAATALHIAREAEGLDPVLTQGAARMALALPGASEVERTSAEALLTAASETPHARR